jgi:hypothetical protein
LTTLASEGLAPVSPGWRGLTASPYAILDVAATRGALDAAVASVSERAAIRPAAVPVLRNAYAEGRAMIAAGIAATPNEAHRAIHVY